MALVSTTPVSRLIIICGVIPKIAIIKHTGKQIRIHNKSFEYEPLLSNIIIAAMNGNEATINAQFNLKADIFITFSPNRISNLETHPTTRALLHFQMIK